MLNACLRFGAAAALIGGLALVPTSSGATVSPAYPFTPFAPGYNTATPIQHLVVIFQENVSFDHYFGTYPYAANPSGEPAFTPASGTPVPNNYTSNPSLLTDNPNHDVNGNRANPFRLDRSQAITCDQDHGYVDEQQAFDSGAMDHFDLPSGKGGTNVTSCGTETAGNGSTFTPYGNPNLVMGYYDGNTVTGMWNLAQHFSMSDNAFGTTYGPSTPGVLNLVAGQTHGFTETGKGTPDGTVVNNTVIDDDDPTGDDCSAPPTLQATGAGTPSGKPDQNIGNLLSADNVSWGWFQGGFAPTSVTSAGQAVCGSQHADVAGVEQADYSAHHEGFQYFPSGLNMHHVAPASEQQIGQSDPSGTPAAQAVNHQYDLSLFYTALADGNLPAVSFVKAPRFEDAHAHNSNPLDEQRFLADVIDTLEQSPDWSSTAVVVTYDDSDGWYDHVFHAPVNAGGDPSTDVENACAFNNGQDGPIAGYKDRCGPGPRLPFMVISPWARQNYIDHTFIDQSSIIKFIEENWGLPSLGDGAFESLSGLNDSGPSNVLTEEGPGAGDLTSMFNWDPSANAPAVLLNDTTGEVERVIPADGSSAPSGSSDSQGQDQNQQSPQGQQSQSDPPASSAENAGSGQSANTDKGSQTIAANQGGTPGLQVQAAAQKLPGVPGPASGSTLCSVVPSGHGTAIVSCAGGPALAQVASTRRVTARLVRGTSVIARGAGPVGHISVRRLHGRKALKAGAYLLELSIGSRSYEEVVPLR